MRVMGRMATALEAQKVTGEVEAIQADSAAADQTLAVRAGSQHFLAGHHLVYDCLLESMVEPKLCQALNAAACHPCSSAHGLVLGLQQGS